MLQLRAAKSLVKYGVAGKETQREERDSDGHMGGSAALQVMVVDPNAVSCALLVAALRDGGIDALQVDSCEEALFLLTRGRALPDCLLLDGALPPAVAGEVPPISGFELLSLLRSCGLSKAKLPVAMLAMTLSPAVLERAGRKGANGTLKRTARAEEVVAAIRHLDGSQWAPAQRGSELDFAMMGGGYDDAPQEAEGGEALLPVARSAQAPARVGGKKLHGWALVRGDASAPAAAPARPRPGFFAQLTLLTSAPPPPPPYLQRTLSPPSWLPSARRRHAACG